MRTCLYCECFQSGVYYFDISLRNISSQLIIIAAKSVARSFLLDRCLFDLFCLSSLVTIGIYIDFFK